MRNVKTVLMALTVAASLYAATGTAWARSESSQRGTAWTDGEGQATVGEPSGASWELFDLGF